MVDNWGRWLREARVQGIHLGADHIIGSQRRCGPNVACGRVVWILSLPENNQSTARRLVVHSEGLVTFCERYHPSLSPDVFLSSFLSFQPDPEPKCSNPRILIVVPGAISESGSLTRKGT